MTAIERCSHPHAWPAIECNEGVTLTRSRRVPVCLCGDLKVVHEYGRAGRTDCGMCDCRHYETARAQHRLAVTVWAAVLAACAVFWTAVWFGIGEPLARAVWGAIFHE